MNIYKVTFYKLEDRKFCEIYHKNFQHLKDAKEHVKTRIQESKRIFEDNNFHVMEYDYKKDNRYYLADLFHDSRYDTTIIERFDIVEEQVY